MKINYIILENFSNIETSMDAHKIKIDYYETKSTVINVDHSYRMVWIYMSPEGTDEYNAVIYFNKDGKNYMIKGNEISYDESDYFINSCKDIINSMTKKEEKSGFSKF